MTKMDRDSLNHEATFTSLQTLVGSWFGVNEDGHPTTMIYSMTADDTALVEDWKFHDGMEALTIYHMDFEILMATHYCPIGNQPRLDLKHRLDDGTLKFECVSATHLSSFDDPHEHAFSLRLNSDGTIYREETYMEKDGQLHSNGILFQRQP